MLGEAGQSEPVVFGAAAISSVEQSKPGYLRSWRRSGITCTVDN
jgi:hypothetical protein